MKITISGYGEDEGDRTIRYILSVENEHFKGTVEFYGYVDIFKQFTEELAKFPFESKDPVEFYADGLSIIISLLDPAGRINFKVSINDDEKNSVEFNDTTVETEMLQRLSGLLHRVNFSNKASIDWRS